MKLLSIVAVITVVLHGAAEALTPKWEKLKDEASYLFEAYVEDFGKIYKSEEEYSLRKAMFQRSIETITKHNRLETSYKMGINRFMDLHENELPLGFDKSSDAWRLSLSNSYELVFQEFQNMRPYSGRYYATVQLPDSVDWRTQANVVTPVKEQGKCGSCWAFAATTALETHIALSTGKLFMLSVQELVSCVGNLRDCGGQGGCNGSTAELAYNFIATHGIVEEWVFGYQSFDGQNVTCTLLGNETTAGEESVFRGAFAMEERSLARNQSSTNIKGAVASILGFANLPTNNYYSLVHAVATHGPVVVNIACADWRLYSHGIFDDDKATDRNINHVVVVEGYGTDQETGQDYWLVRNSWGALWGEDGYIRLKRVDPSSLDNPGADCKMDVTPAEGVACTKDESGKDVTPVATKVCGTSGILYDGVIPVGGHLL